MTLGDQIFFLRRSIVCNYSLKVYVKCVLANKITCSMNIMFILSSIVLPLILMIMHVFPLCFCIMYFIVYIVGMMRYNRNFSFMLMSVMFMMNTLYMSYLVEYFVID